MIFCGVPFINDVGFVCILCGRILNRFLHQQMILGGLLNGRPPKSGCHDVFDTKWFHRDSLANGPCCIFCIIITAATSLLLLHPKKPKKPTSRILIKVFIYSPSKMILSCNSLDTPPHSFSSQKNVSHK